MSTKEKVDRGRKALRLKPKSEATKKQQLKSGMDKVAISSILLRKDDDTRPLIAEHVVTLAESIAVLGLLEPIVLDTEGHLLAGGHRLAALQLLAIEDNDQRLKEFFTRLEAKLPSEEDITEATEALDSDDENRIKKIAQPTRLALQLNRLDLSEFKKISSDNNIHVQIINVSGKGREGFDLAIEAAENTVRRSYTKEEVVSLANRLEKAGYPKVKGRVESGKKSLMMALEAAMGRSKRQIQRIIKGEQSSGSQKTYKASLLALVKAANSIKKAAKRENEDIPSNLDKAIEAIMQFESTRSKEKPPKEATAPKAPTKNMKKSIRKPLKK
ncbi:MAG: ParB N-terminal domain-containing protein [Planctomycetes bacterium]|nr:ParB N-terminal domain-containing protein [Planctomycetota bacterium]